LVLTGPFFFTTAGMLHVSSLTLHPYKNKLRSYETRRFYERNAHWWQWWWWWWHARYSLTPPPSIALAIQARDVIKNPQTLDNNISPHCFAHQKSCTEKVPKCYASL